MITVLHCLSAFLLDTDCVWNAEGLHCLLVRLVLARAAMYSRSWWTICRLMLTYQHLSISRHKRVPTRHRCLISLILISVT